MSAGDNHAHGWALNGPYKFGQGTDAEAGSFGVLPPGYKFESWDPDYPHQNYENFVKARLRSIASGLGIAYHTLANDLSDVNFSSARAGTLEERDNWIVLQNSLNHSIDIYLAVK